MISSRLLNKFRANYFNIVNFKPKFKKIVNLDLYSNLARNNIYSRRSSYHHRFKLPLFTSFICLNYIPNGYCCCRCYHGTYFETSHNGKYVKEYCDFCSLPIFKSTRFSKR